MSRFLSRSKSHRELRTKFVLDSHEELPSFPPQLPQEKQPHTPAKLIRKRAGTIAANPAHNRLMKQKSMDSVLRPGTAMSGGSSQRTAKLGDHRISSSPKPIQYTGIHPPRTTSRASLHSTTNEAPCIGVALGSPTVICGSSIAIDTPSTVCSGTGSTPAFVLPQEPFEMGGEERKMSTSNGASESSERGWRKLFGRSLFGTKKLSKKHQQSPTPYITKSEGNSQSSSQTVTENYPVRPHAQATPLPHFPLLTPPSSKPAPKSGNTPSSCLLDVNIPSTEMERYSIMFSALLQNDCLPEIPQRKPSLYDRRHERKRSNTTTGAVIKKDPPRLHLSPLRRHATTGGRSNSRSASPNVFDSEWPPSNTVGIAYSRSPLGRSNTTAFSSSIRPSSSGGHGFVLAGSEELENGGQNNNRAAAADSLKRSESRSSKMTQQDPSIDTPRDSFDEGDDEWLQRIDEPVSTAISNGPLWEMIKNNPDQPIPIPPVKNEQEAVIAAEISIARQISVSQRQLNHPVLSRLDSTTTRHNQHIKEITIKRQQSAKVMTPRIVNTSRNGNTRIRASQNVEYGDVATLKDSNSSSSSIISGNIPTEKEKEKGDHDHHILPKKSASAAAAAAKAANATNI